MPKAFRVAATSASTSAARRSAGYAGLRGDLEIVNNPDGTVRLAPTGEFTTQRFDSVYDKWPPSLNIAAGVTDEFVVRLGLFRAMSRADPRTRSGTAVQREARNHP